MTRSFPDSAAALEAAQRALISCRHLIRKYIPAHDWVPHIDEDIEMVKAARAAIPDVAATPQGPPLRLCGYCQTWNSKPCGNQCHWSPSDPVHTPAVAQPLAARAPEQETLVRQLRQIATEFAIDNKTDCKQHVCWIAADRLCGVAQAGKVPLDAEHPDNYRLAFSKRWTVEQFWQFAEGLTDAHIRDQLRDTMAERGLSLSSTEGK